MAPEHEANANSQPGTGPSRACFKYTNMQSAPAPSGSTEEEEHTCTASILRQQGIPQNALPNTRARNRRSHCHEHKHPALSAAAPPAARSFLHLNSGICPRCVQGFHCKVFLRAPELNLWKRPHGTHPGSSPAHMSSVRLPDLISAIFKSKSQSSGSTQLHTTHTSYFQEQQQTKITTEKWTKHGF